MFFALNNYQLDRLCSQICLCCLLISLLSSPVNNDVEERDKVIKDNHELSSEGSVESMLFVEKGLRELTSLKVLTNTSCHAVCQVSHLLKLMPVVPVTFLESLNLSEKLSRYVGYNLFHQFVLVQKCDKLKIDMQMSSCFGNPTTNEDFT